MVKTKVKSDFTFPATVMLTVPGVDQPQQVTIHFRHKGRKDLATWINSGNGRPDAEFLGEVVAGWGEEFVDEHDQPAPFTPEAFAALLDSHHPAAHEIYQAYLRAIGESRVKN